VALVIDGVLVKSAIPEKFTGHLYTHPQHTWVGLTNEERMDILLNLHRDKILSHMDTALAIEAKLKEKNT
jgi:hypothetical protein